MEKCIVPDGTYSSTLLHVFFNAYNTKRDGGKNNIFINLSQQEL